jgi:hypothetical protein
MSIAMHTALTPKHALSCCHCKRKVEDESGDCYCGCFVGDRTAVVRRAVKRDDEVGDVKHCLVR